VIGPLVVFSSDLSNTEQVQAHRRGSAKSLTSGCGLPPSRQQTGKFCLIDIPVVFAIKAKAHFPLVAL
jgi:hypothetical protein